LCGAPARFPRKSATSSSSAASAIDAIARVPGARLLLVSRSDAGPFRAHAAAAGVAARVSFLPPTDRIERMYAAADGFVFPTPYDAFGMVIAEAMAMGLPVVTTRRAGASELVEDGVSGVLVDGPGDVEAIAQRVAALVADRDFAGKVGRAARARVATQSWDDVARRTRDEYRRALERPSAVAA
jgi:glycosyltransferase involved in cell wall biosynthesis